MPARPNRFQATIPGVDWYAGAGPLFKRSAGRKRGCATFDVAARERACELVRGVLIDRLDAAFESGELGRLLWQGEGDSPLLRTKGVDVFQAIQAALFPEAYLDDGEYARRAAEVRAGRPCGLVPAPGTGLLNRCGGGRLAAFARLLAGPTG